jgi:hypothetical protein
MPPLPSLQRLPASLGCVLGMAAMLLLTGCGDGTAATAGGNAPAQTTAASRPAPPKPEPATLGCPARVDAFVEAMASLRRQLAIGLSYEQYAARVKALRHDHERIPVDHLALACLRTTGTPAEAALNKYVDAANAWGECLADAACTTATIEPVLQRKWRLASHFLAEAG